MTGSLSPCLGDTGNWKTGGKAARSWHVLRWNDGDQVTALLEDTLYILHFLPRQPGRSAPPVQRVAVQVRQSFISSGPVEAKTPDVGYSKNPVLYSANARFPLSKVRIATVECHPFWLGFT